MNKVLMGVGVVAVVVLLGACQQQETPPAKPAQPSSKPSETQAASQVKAEESYMTPQEGEKAGKQPLEVVDKNLSEAAGEPSVMPAAEGPESVVFETSMGAVTFPHEEHGAMIACGACHGEGEPAGLELDKESAHKLCRGCHQERGAGPTGCKDCHVKSS